MKKRNYSPIRLGDTANLSNEEWLKWRQHGPFYADPMNEQYVPVGIGGSDISTIACKSPWGTRLELFHQKTGVQPKVRHEFNAGAKAAGHIYEPYVADMFVKYMTEEEGQEVEVWNDTGLFQHPDYPFALVNLDRMMKIKVGNKWITGIMECKTTSSHNFETIKKWKAGICPEYYEYQCRYYMATMNLDYVYICCCWGFNISDMAVVLIKRDLDIEDKMMKMVSDFVEACELGIEPDVTDENAELLNNYYMRLYGEIIKRETPVELPDKYRNEVLQAMLLNDEITQLEQRLEEAKNRREEIYKLFYPIYGNADYGTYRLNDDEIVGISLKVPMSRPKFDEDRFKKENPDVYKQYQIEKFDCTTFGKKEKNLKKKYMLPAEVNAEKAPYFELKKYNKPL